jgi:ABC-type branched-subunit amino acid transport system substrate-binding protein
VSYSLTAGRRAISNNFSVEPSPKSGAPTGAFNYFKKKFPDAVTAVGTIYSEVSKGSHDDYKAAAESVGWHYVYERGVQATETDFTADVVRMRQGGVKGVYLVAVDVKTAARLAKAMAQQSFKPDFFIVNGAGYDPSLFSLAGEAVEGMFNSQPYAMFDGEDGAAVPEVKLFNDWLQKVKPGYKPDLFAAFAWGSGRLFFQALEAAGPKAKRADVIAALKKIETYSANGMLAPAGPATKRPPECYIILQVKGGKFERFDSPPPGYRCSDGPYLVRQK